MNLGMDDLWYLIEDLAERSRPRQDQSEPLEDIVKKLADAVHHIQDEAEKSWERVEEAQKGSAYQMSEMLKLRAIEEESAEPLGPLLHAEPIKELDPLTLEPGALGPFDTPGAPEADADPVPMDEPPEKCPILADPSEKDPILVDELLETSPVLVADKYQLDPAPQFCMRITPPGAYATHDEKGSCLTPLAFDGKVRNFQTREVANRSCIKKRPRHGMFEWKPGWRNTKAQLDGPAAMVKGPSPAQRNVKEKPPDQLRAEPSASTYEHAGQIVGLVEGKFDLTRPWDLNM